MKSRSLTQRVLTIVIVAQLLCAVLLSGFALFHERHTRLRAFDESLKGRSDSVLGAIQDAEDLDSNVTVDTRELKLPRGDVYKVYSADGRVLGATAHAPFELKLQAQNSFFDEVAGGVTYRVYQQSGLRIIDRAETSGVGRSRPVIILYAASKAHLQHEILEAVGVYTSIILLVIAGTGLLLILMVRQALSPLKELATAAARVSAPSLTFETPASVNELRELRPLADVLNQVLGSLREAFAKERRFLGDAAHELKTAVAVVRSTAQLLMLKQRTVLEYTKGLAGVVEDIARVEALVGQMLSSSAADEDQSGVVSALSLAQVVASVGTTLAPFAAQREVSFARKGGEQGLVRLREDRAMVLVSNLVLNAIQHSDPGALVTATLSRNEHAEVVLAVQDTGSGISEAALPHVFERFYREDRSRSRETGGAGLGLAICKSIVEAAGGSITIASKVGSGTTVCVTFIEA